MLTGVCQAKLCGLGSRGVRHSLAEQVELVSTIHAAFDQFEAVNLPFYLAVAPGLGDRRARPPHSAEAR